LINNHHGGGGAQLIDRQASNRTVAIPSCPWKRHL